MKYGLLGEKLGHSFSPQIHAMLGEYPYELKELAPEEFERFIGGRDYQGLNVTIPYKEMALRACDQVSPQAAAIGAVNTVVNRDGILYGDNTDFAGLRYLITSNGIEIADRSVAILGTGGTSKTARAVAADLGAREVLVFSRRPEEGQYSYEQVAGCSQVEVLINTTPVGMYPNIGEAPVSVGQFPNLRAVVDVIYNPLKTALILEAEALGIPAVSGLGMLVAQAKFAAELFLGTEIPDGKIPPIERTLYQQMVNIVLIGMPSAGKTTVGQMLGQKLQKEFIDVDDTIIAADGRAIPDIFQEDGEAGFRKLERERIAALSALHGKVIATGGGAVKDPRNMENLRKNGIVFFLQRDLDNLRVGEGRPLSSSVEALRQMEQERLPLYRASADIQVNNNGSLEHTVQRIIEAAMGEDF